MTLFYRLPEWACFIATLIFVQISHEIGFRIGTMRRLKPGENPETAAGTISGVAIGLLAFMLAFTFNGASNNHDLRKDLLIDEANIVRTAYQRSMQLPDPYCANVRDLLREYVDIRLNMSQHRRGNFKQVFDRMKVIQHDLWSTALELQKKEPNTPMLGLFTESLNELFNLNAKRSNAFLQGRISIIIWIVLYFLTFITMTMVGYRIGLHGIRSTFMEITLALAFSAVLLLIITLDHPNGMLKVDPRPLADVLKILGSGS
ncbi:MAG: hypothetical protein NT036_04930 [Candidatus Omnitrophica bacterium]|nr:hypothetical protein [Candidatus Omnitrophota bacterium]